MFFFSDNGAWEIIVRRVGMLEENFYGILCDLNPQNLNCWQKVQQKWIGGGSESRNSSSVRGFKLFNIYLASCSRSTVTSTALFGVKYEQVSKSQRFCCTLCVRNSWKCICNVTHNFFNRSFTCMLIGVISTTSYQLKLGSWAGIFLSSCLNQFVKYEVSWLL